MRDSGDSANVVEVKRMQKSIPPKGDKEGKDEKKDHGVCMFLCGGRTAVRMLGRQDGCGQRFISCGGELSALFGR